MTDADVRILIDRARKEVRAARENCVRAAWGLDEEVASAAYDCERAAERAFSALAELPPAAGFSADLVREVNVVADELLDLPGIVRMARLFGELTRAAAN